MVSHLLLLRAVCFPLALAGYGVSTWVQSQRYLRVVCYLGAKNFGKMLRCIEYLWHLLIVDSNLLEFRKLCLCLAHYENDACALPFLLLEGCLAFLPANLMETSQFTLHISCQNTFSLANNPDFATPEIEKNCRKTDRFRDNCKPIDIFIVRINGSFLYFVPFEFWRTLFLRLFFW